MEALKGKYLQGNMMREKDLKETGLADMAFKVESDHEVQMARAELYKCAKYAIKMHEMLKGVEEREGLEGWVQSKITKAADYLSTVYHHMDYEMKFDEVAEGKKAKPDYIDIDGDGNKKEPMKKAVKDKEAKKDKKVDEQKKETPAEYMKRTGKKPTKVEPGTGEAGKKAIAKFKKSLGKSDKIEKDLDAKDKAEKEKQDESYTYEDELKDRLAENLKKKNNRFQTLEESVGKPITEDEFERLAEKKDACYHKVKARYKVWPSAYASGALVQCRKKGAKNWGNKS